MKEARAVGRGQRDASSSFQNRSQGQPHLGTSTGARTEARPMFAINHRIARLPAILLAVALSSSPALAVSWVEQGPGPDLNGGTEGIPNNPVSGAVNAIAIDPTDADVIYAGTVNGGVWKTTNGTSASPAWTALTDKKLPAQSITSLAISPANHKWLFAGTGSTSADAFEGSPGFGVARSTNGGGGWKVIAASTFTGRAITSIVPTGLNGGKVVLAATLFDNGGVYRSTDKGDSFTRLSGDGVSGLPDQGVSNLVADPGNSARFYAAVPTKTGVGATGSEGVYTSTDGGQTWVPVNTGLTGLNTSLRILLSVHANSGLATNAVYAMVIGTSGHLQAVFRSGNFGGNWTSMSVPSPEIYPGAQGIIHGAIVADPSDPNIVFVAGDRQDNPSGFPNSNGCNTFSGSAFRGNAVGNVWENVVCSGANGTSPHADSRAMVFDASGNILHGCDGGFYKLANPNTPASRQWSSVNGNLRPSEIHSVAYDPLSGIVFGGTQDNGTAIQSAPGNQTWNVFQGGDGGNVAVDADQTAHPGTSLRYTSFQKLGSFTRSTFDAGNTFLGFSPVGLNITSGPLAGFNLLSIDPNIQFYNPYVLNAINPARMLIGTANIYESMNKGDSLANLGFTGFFITSLAYGSRLGGVDKPDVFYVGADAHVLHRVNVGDPIATLGAYPGSVVLSVVMDPQDYQNVFVLDDSNRVWASLDEGVTWNQLTANLGDLSSDTGAMEIFNPGGTKDRSILIVGGLGGAFQLKAPLTTTKPKWKKLSSKLPRVLVADLHYDYTNNVLVAGTLGRGAWTLTEAFAGGKNSAQAAQPAQASQVDAMDLSLRLPDLPLPAPPPAARLEP
jgi:hypothetical protein